ncbi:G-protein coupled receptor family C group 6 member A, partial [Anabarilius grahami]
AVVHTIETINNSSYLPGVRLGYYICDTCSDASKAIQSTERLLAVNGTLPVQCEVLERPNVKAIIGARFSEDSLAVARLLSLYMVPQISTTSSAQTLSDRVRYPAFLRTIPSDVHQTKALANFMKHFHWDWVGVVYGDDDYGKNALQSFLADAENLDICHAFKEVLPHYLAHDEIDKRIQEVAETIRSSEAKVVLLILKEELVSKLFKEMIRQNISRTWIASDAWSMSRNISRMDGINQLGDIFGFTFITGPNPGFKEFLHQLTLAQGSVNLFLEEYKQLGKDTGFLTEAVDISTTYGERGRQILYALGFSLAVSCILVKALRTFATFLPPYRLESIKRFYNPPVIITCGTLIQVLICIFWMIFDSPVVETFQSDQSMLITVQCNEGSGIGFAIMLCYIALLAFICFLLAFKGRKVPQRFNETGHIILSMLVYLFVWVCFTPVYIAKINERYSIQAAAILVSCYGIIFCHFAPKWYMALCKKKEEISREAYIAKANNHIVDSIDLIPEITEEPNFIMGSQNTINSVDTGLGSIQLTRKELHQENNTDNMEFLYQTIRKRPRRKSI